MVRLRSDLVVGEEFDLVDLTLMRAGDSGPALHIEVNDLEPSYQVATVLGEFRDIRPGSYELLTSPRIAGTDLLASPQRTFVQVDQDALAFTVLLSRSCLNVLCGDGESCFQGQCVDARCTQESPEFCGGALCEEDRDCGEVSECAAARCDAGACWFEARAASEANACDADTEWCHPEAGCLERGETPESANGGTSTVSDPPTIYFRDDMENGLLGAADSTNLGGGNLQIVDSPVHSGDGSLEVTLEGSAQAANLEKEFSPALVSGLLYTRVFVYLDGSTTFGDTMVVLRFDDDDASGAAQDKVSLNIGPDRDLRFSSNASNEHVGSLDGVMPDNQWTCLEFIVDLHETNGSIAVRLDGEEVLSGVGGMNTLPAGGVSEFDYGVPFASLESPSNIRLLLDDLVVANYEVGCEE